jgi:hypothetical protein
MGSRHRRDLAGPNCQHTEEELEQDQNGEEESYLPKRTVLRIIPEDTSGEDKHQYRDHHGPQTVKKVHCHL